MSPRRRPLRAADVIRLAMTLPGVTLRVGARARSLTVGGRLLARFRDDDATLVLRLPIAVRDYLRTSAPEKFFLGRTYLEHPYVLARIATLTRAELKPLLEEGWRNLKAPTPRSASSGAAGAPRSPR